MGAGVSVVDPFSAYGFDNREIVIKPFIPRIEFKLWALFPVSRKRKRLVDDFLTFLRMSIDELRDTEPAPRSKAKVVENVRK
jgi:hypothetical protein